MHAKRARHERRWRRADEQRCGTTSALETGNHTIDVDGTPRDYILALPDNYDSSNPYTLIFGWHWRGGSAQDVAGGDIAFTEEMLAPFRSELCIDESRIFSTGFSYGGMMSFAVGCALGDVFRAIAPMAGALYSGCEDGTAPVAVSGSHGYSGPVTWCEWDGGHTVPSFASQAIWDFFSQF